MTLLIFLAAIDKVLVHKGLSTLDVLVLALLITALFDSLLGWLRTYTFAHTTSRADAILGAQLFGHLLGLPLAYFETRPAGQTVARVRELENVRQFIASSALTLVLDLLFDVFRRHVAAEPEADHGRADLDPVLRRAVAADHAALEAHNR